MRHGRSGSQFDPEACPLQVRSMPLQHRHSAPIQKFATKKLLTGANGRKEGAASRALWGFACVSAVLIELSESRPMVLAAVPIRVPTVAFKFSWTNVCVTRGHTGVKLILCGHGKGRRDPSAEHSMRITVGYSDPARGQVRKLLRTVSSWAIPGPVPSGPRQGVVVLFDIISSDEQSLM